MRFGQSSQSFVRVGSARPICHTLPTVEPGRGAQRWRYQRGETPEEIFEDSPSIGLADIYATIAYYLRHTEDVERHLREYEEAADRLPAKLEALYPTAGLREELLRRIEEKRRVEEGE
jgi:hypothetical protein